MDKVDYEKYLEIKNKKISIMMSVLSLLIVAGFGYAYFSLFPHEGYNEKFSTTTGSISLKFKDNDNGISGTLNLEQTIVKSFVLENIGTTDAYAKINWVDLVNTYTSQSLSYTLEQGTNENGTYEVIGKGNVPTSSNPKTLGLKDGIFVPVNGKYYYNLKIKLNNLNINQNSDINATFKSYFNLQEGNSSGAGLIQNLVKGAKSSNIDVITGNSSDLTCTNTLAYDGTVDNNLRYVGTNPCNYVLFNNELWRIVGVMNNVDDGTGKKETRIKLIRSTNLGAFSWDSSNENINYGWGINDWVQSDLKNELNGDYLNTSLVENQFWYDDKNNQKNAEYVYTASLNSISQGQIENAKWALGGISNIEINANNFYVAERGTNVWGSTSGQTCNDGACPRATQWTGKVALMYPSDYAFAVGGQNREYCLENNTIEYGTNSCSDYNWLNPDSWSRTLSPSTEDAYSTIGIANDSESIYIGMLYDADDVMPVVYLKSNINFLSGNGSKTDPYIIE